MALRPRDEKAGVTANSPETRILALNFDASFDAGIGEVDSQYSIREDGLALRQFLSIDLHILRRGRECDQDYAR